MKKSTLRLLLLFLVVAIPSLTQTACKTLAAGAAGAAIGAAAQKHHDDKDDDDRR